MVRVLWRCALPAIVAVVAACSGSEGPAHTEDQDAPAEERITATTLGEQMVLSNDEYLAATEYAGADRERGERLSMQCRACHSLDSGGTHMLGPALYGFFGKSAGFAEGFAYSPALSGAEFVWTPRALDAWLAQPAAFLPGNRMAYVGLSRLDDRRALIAYLLAATDDTAAE